MQKGAHVAPQFGISGDENWSFFFLTPWASARPPICIRVAVPPPVKDAPPPVR